ncbi:MAG: altronate dehydratase family protein [Geminicoccaceae bacterium]
MATAPLTVRLNPNDNVVVARVDILPGTELAGEGLAATQRIPAGHKVATRPIPLNEPIRKFDQIIGFATKDIAPGEHIHVHNCGMREFARDYAVGQDVRPIAMVPEAERPSFGGFVRGNGKVGTRNYIGILSTVNCSASVSKFIAERFPQEVLAQYPNVDGVVAITHGTGCGMADRGEGYATLQRTLWGFAAHPNFASILMIGLGCEVMQLSFMKEVYGIESGPAFRTMTLQGEGGTRRTIEHAHAMIREMLPHANSFQRQPVSVGEISLALQCGGSDGYSGITANPALGHCADLLVRHGGTAILSETPEIYGAEHLLTRRAVSQEIADKLIERIHWWEEYCERNGGEMNNNPSPGNKAGGLTTILEKSLGAAAKGGTTNLAGVYKYAEPITQKGFVYMDSPGYDPASATGQVASGGNVIAFTTGRGSCFGFKPTPSLKIATNTAMYRRMEEDMDVNAGTIIEGEETIEQVGRRIFDLVVRVAGGEQSKSEELGMGDNEFVPWQIGAVM